jgi:hypothetical protein
LKYNTLRSSSDQPPSGRAGSVFQLPFQSSWYRINNNLDSYVAELNSTFGGKMANNLKVVYTQLRDFRETPYLSNPFPLVDIRNGVSTQVSTTFGYEPFTAFNVLDTDVLQISDDVTLYSGKNVFTFGVAYEDNQYKNGFAPDYNTGYVFKSFDDFYTSVNTGVSNAVQFRQRWTNTQDFPFAKMRGSTVSFYGQDEINIAKGFKLTVGLRADGTSIPVEINKTTTNTFVPGLTFRDGVKTATDKFPDFTLLFSPRIGFNWDVNEERKTQVRGGLGVFSGRVPYVWLSNQLSNNGVLFGSQTLDNTAGVTGRPFDKDVNKYRPTVDFGSVIQPVSYNLNVTDPNFKFPQIFRANMAIDHSLGDGWLATFEGIYTKDINAVTVENINLPTSARNAIGADNRPIYYNVGTNGFPSTKYNRIYGSSASGGLTAPASLSATSPDISEAILIKNTNNGYSYALTGTIAKTFESGLFASLSYTYTDSRSVNDGGTTALGIWSGRQVSGDPNADVLSYSNFLQKHRIVAFGSYKLDYAKWASTTFGFSYSVGPAGRFSYVYNGDMNGDVLTSNDLIYIPRDNSEILLRAVGTYTAAQQWTDLDNYIKQDSYLNSRRGQYAERNGGELPWSAQFDFKVIQDFYIKTGKKTNTFQLTFDLFNAGNYVTPNWGINQGTVRAPLISFAGYDNATGFVATGSAPTGKPVFTFPFRTGTTPLADSFQNLTSLTSRWQGQIGIRYIFN